ncbi:PD-(D/E)XK nuclease family protein [Basilea psittacipulmonis]|uniref:PD-(D/E)XK endonuclease-like domain-containing protein n=1 Tax=Basilea psittacipulmonis DSM 24701 TaxID=1072685 RepID=A0A077DIB3_9BURK|nr:PD-(D/E)XK nuclease family protein [Basilea psittacipulmonis]AIL33222.1 hypothetical protein IX83_07880 [Basilea psittacipulmonis DSM 24701]
MQLITSQDELLSLIEKKEANTWIITGSNSLSYQLRKDLSRLSSKKVFELPTIFPYRSALQKFYTNSIRNLAPDHVYTLLDKFSSLYLWQNIIQQNKADLLDISGTARAAFDAYEIESLWQVQVNDHETTPEYEQLCRWKKSYLETLKSKQCIDSVMLVDLLLTLSQEHRLNLPEQIILYSLDSLTPKERLLLESLDCSLFQYEPNHEVNESRTCLAFDSFDEELAAAFQYAREIEKESKTQFAVLVPNLKQNLYKVHRIATYYLGDRYHVSLGRELNQWPLIRYALTHLEFMKDLAIKKSVTNVQWGKWLEQAKAFQMEGIHYHQCIVWANEVRHKEKLSYRQSEIIEKLSLSPTLASSLAALLNAWNQIQDIHEWTDIFYQSLELFGFPNPSFNQSAHITVTDDLNESLESFTNLSYIVPPLNAQTALRLFNQFINNRSSQLRATTKNIVSIRDLSSAQGLSWDTAWIVGLNDHALPEPVHINHFLPFISQDKAGVPTVNIHRSKAQSLTRFQGICSRTKKLILSTHLKDEKGNELQISPFLNDDDIHHLEAKTKDIPDYSGFHITKKEPFYLNEQQPRQLKGGYGLLEMAAQNMLAAHARYRLQLQALRDFNKGFNASTRGNLRHLFMELVWKKVKTLTALKTLLQNKEKKDKLLDDISQTVKEKTIQTLGIDHYNLLDYEVQTARQSCELQLNLDVTLNDFTSVDLEHQVEWTHEGIKITLRADRVDRLKNGGMRIIDYKSGRYFKASSEINAWSCSNEISYQLPLYAVALPQTSQLSVGELAYSNLQPHEVKFESAFCQEDGTIAKRSLTAKNDDVYIGKIENIYKERKSDISFKDNQFTAFVNYYQDTVFGTLCQKLAKECIENISFNDVKNHELHPFLRQWEINE